MWTSRWHTRVLVLASVVVVPFLGFLITNRYPLLRLETASAMALLLVSCGFTFYLATIACGCVISAVPLQEALSAVGRFPIPIIVTGLALAAASLMIWLRERFFGTLVVFSLGTFIAHCIAVLGMPVRSGDGPTAEPLRRQPTHFLYVVLDEHMGPGGLPVSIPACRQAARAIETTFSRHGFRLYPYAFSNYPSTIRSLKSILSGRLLNHQELSEAAASPGAHGFSFPKARRFLDEFRSRGYRTVVIQDRRFSFAPGEPGRVVEYSDELGAVADTSWPWQEKAQVIVGKYQGSDRVLSRFKGLFPLFRFRGRYLDPLSVASVWPERLANEITGAKVPTFFFAHLLTPHGPYVYRRDGSVRRIAEWAEDLSYGILEPETYYERYTRYAQQIEFLQSQLDWLLRTLRDRGLLEKMTIVLHGDHGSRIRLRKPWIANVSGPPGAKVDRYDYSSAPASRDLLDRFSTLLAIRLPGECGSITIPRKGSVLRILSEVVYHRDPSFIGPGADSVFLFDERGDAREIRLLEIWKD